MTALSWYCECSTLMYSGERDLTPDTVVCENCGKTYQLKDVTDYEDR